MVSDTRDQVSGASSPHRAAQNAKRETQNAHRRQTVVVVPCIIAASDAGV